MMNLGADVEITYTPVAMSAAMKADKTASLVYKVG